MRARYAVLHLALVTTGPIVFRRSVLDRFDRLDGDVWIPVDVELEAWLQDPTIDEVDQPPLTVG